MPRTAHRHACNTYLHNHSVMPLPTLGATGLCLPLIMLCWPTWG